LNLETSVGREGFAISISELRVKRAEDLPADLVVASRTTGQRTDLPLKEFVFLFGSLFERKILFARESSAEGMGGRRHRISQGVALG
jgi:hypothetical protein